MSGPITDTGAWQSWWDKTGSQPPVGERTPPPAAFPLRSVRQLPAPASAPPRPDPATGPGSRRAERGRSGRRGRPDEPYDALPAPGMPGAGAGRGARRAGAPRADLAPGGLADSRSRLADSAAGLHPLGPPRGLADPGAGRLAGPARSRLADSAAGLHPLGPPRGLADPGAGRQDAGEPGRSDPSRPRAETRTRRGGATRADLATPGTHGATALAPRADPAARPAPPVPAGPPVPDEITDTGARRARSTFRVAEGPAEEDFDDEPSLVLQWGVFLAQTLTGAAVGLGVWLGFYRLWSTWPFYAAPAVGVAFAGMLAVARTLRRRYGHELDLLTAVVTIAVGTVLTVLPAAFTLQSVG